MKLSVDFPSVAFGEGPQKVSELARAIEEIGYDELAVFDHVVMGHPTETRPRPIYPPQMPILEALVLLGFAAAVTERVGLSTEVLVLPQRQPVLVAKQVSTLDVLSNGRVRLGVGIGWQEAEYDALEEDFTTRGRRMDEAIGLLRAYWRDETVDFTGRYYTSTAMALEPKPPQGAALPIWIGGTSAAALRRAGQLGDGWMGSTVRDDAGTKAAIAEIHRHAEDAGRDPALIGLQLMVAPPPRAAADKAFYADHDGVARRVEEIRDLGVEWASLNATAIYQAGARSVPAMIDELGRLHDRLRTTVG